MTTKTSNKNLSSLIKSANFDWVNSKIEEYFTLEDVRGEFRLFHFNNQISSEKAIVEMQKEGYEPANATELVTYAANGWDETDWVVALGASARVHGGRYVVYLRGSGVERSLYLHDWGGDWDGGWRFLGVRVSGTQSLGTSDTLSLGNLIARIEKLEKLFNPELLKTV